jgi:hypothetical protein
MARKVILFRKLYIFSIKYRRKIIKYLTLNEEMIYNDPLKIRKISNKSNKIFIISTNNKVQNF